MIERKSGLGFDLLLAIERMADTAFTAAGYMDHINEIAISREAFVALAVASGAVVKSFYDGEYQMVLFDIIVKCEPEACR